MEWNCGLTMIGQYFSHAHLETSMSHFLAMGYFTSGLRNPISAYQFCIHFFKGNEIWGFHKWEYPKMVGLMENPIKMDDLGIPPFQETSVSLNWAGSVFTSSTTEPQLGPLDSLHGSRGLCLGGFPLKPGGYVCMVFRQIFPLFSH